MLKPSQFRELVSGRRRGVGAAALRFGLRVAEVPYTLAVRWRNWRYDTGRAPIHRVPVPVVSVGNLTLGGTGKTPMVQWIARWLRTRGLRVTVISRGYGAQAGAANDEALELEQNLPDVPHLEDPDRVAAARVAVEELACQRIVLDDAFQHRRIHRDLDVVMLDALEPFGFGHVFPRGTLREPLRGLRRADVVVLSRADMLQPEKQPPSPLAGEGRGEGESARQIGKLFLGRSFPADQRARIRDEVRSFAPEAAWAEVIHAPEALLSCGGEREPLETLRGEPVAAFCGIGNPAAFRHTLQRCGYRAVAFREFPDHHGYNRADVDSLIDWAGGLDVRAVVCTHKDLVKLSLDRLGRRPLWAVTIGLEFLAGQAELEAALAAFGPPRGAGEPQQGRS